LDGRPASNSLVTRLFVAGAVTLTGDAVTLVAIPLTAVIVLQASPAELAIVGLAQALPILLLSIPLGAWVDRRMRRWPLLIASDLARAVLLVIVPLAALAGMLSLPLLIAIAFVMSCAGTVFELGLAGWIPRILSGDALHKANARIELSRSGALTVGPMLGGALVAVFTAPIALLADAASFLGSAAIIGSARRAEPPFAPDPTPRRIRDELTAGAGFLRKQRLVAAVASTITINNFSRARVASVLRLLGFGAVPLGTLVGGIIGEFVGLRAALVVSGLGLLAGSVPYLLVRIGHLRTIDSLRPAGVRVATTSS